jgi:hypothetical protein
MNEERSANERGKISKCPVGCKLNRHRPFSLWVHTWPVGPKTNGLIIVISAHGLENSMLFPAMGPWHIIHFEFRFQNM